MIFQMEMPKIKNSKALKTSQLFTYYEDDLKNRNIVSQISTADHYYRIILPFNKIVNELQKSYNRKLDKPLVVNNILKNIISQISLDFSRMEVFLNGSKCASTSELYDYISKYVTSKHSKFQSVYYLIIMFCTQAPFYYPFNVIRDIYSMPDTNLHVVASKDFPNISLSSNKNSVSITIKKNFLLLDVLTNECITKFHTRMLIMIDLINNRDKCTIYWKKED